VLQLENVSCNSSLLFCLLTPVQTYLQKQRTEKSFFQFIGHQ
jgi:hypothetical protein